MACSHYGAKATACLTNEYRVADTVYKAVFLLFIVIGAASSLDIIIGFSDAMIFAMSILNLIGVSLLMRVVERELTDDEDDLRSGVVSKVDA